MILSIALAALLQVPVDGPIRLGNPKIDPQDSSVTYEFVNTAADVTAYEVAITRHFSDGSAVVSTQGQDWFSSSGYTSIRAVYTGEDHTWLPPYPAEQPGTHRHRFTAPSARGPYVVDAEVTLTAVIRSDGTSAGDPKVVARFWSDRRAILGEYEYWVPRLERARRTLVPLDALSWAVHALGTPREGELVAEPREALHRAATDMSVLSERDPSEAARLCEAFIVSAQKQRQRLGAQSFPKP